MNSLVPQTSLLVQSLGWALLQSLWQGLLIYGCLRIVLAFAGKQNARLRYILSMLSLMAMFAWFLGTWAEQWLSLQDTVVTAIPGSYDIRSLKTAIVPGIQDAGIYSSGFLSSLPRHVLPYLPIAVTIYLLGLAFMVARFGISIYEVQKLRSRGLTSPSGEWQQWLQNRKNMLLIARPLQLFYSIHATVPMTIGTLRPVILMPIAMAASLGTDQLEAILLHEMAHIKRHDYLLNIFQTLAETLLFFNPFIWLASAIARREREHCCDDLVLSCADGPLPYAKALAALESYRQLNNMAMAATGNNNKLLNRIKRIMEMKKQKDNYSPAIIATLVIAALVISITCFSPSFAQSARNKGNSQSTTNKTTAAKTYNNKIVPKAPEPAEEAEPAEAPEAPEVPNVAEAPEAPDWGARDKELKKANKERADADREMAHVDWEQVNKEMENANKEMARAGKELAAVNRDEIYREIAKAEKEIDAVDWNEIEREISNSMKEVQKSITDPKIRRQVEQSLELARVQGQKAIAQSRQALEQAQRNTERQKKTSSSYNVAISGSGAGNGGASTYASANNNGYSYGSTNAHAGGAHETMLKKMEQEGLINRSRHYKVEKYGDRLYINGVLQPADVFRKYSKYIDTENLSIKGDRDHINISAKN